MAHSNSAKKRVRQNENRRLRNRRRRTEMKDSIRELEAAVEAKDAKTVDAKLKAACSQIDRVAAKGVLHKKTAARKKSRLAKRANQLAAK